MITELIKLKENRQINVQHDTVFVLVTDSSPEGTQEKVTLEFVFSTPGVCSKVYCLYRGRKNRHFNLETIIRHVAPETSCDVVIKGILEDDAHSNYIGKIVIDKLAQQTTSYLHDYVLVVGQGTKTNSQPILEIDANDVQASHGATTGRISTEDIYYLMSRGLTQPEAQTVIIEGFFADILEKIEEPAIRLYIQDSLGL